MDESLLELENELKRLGPRRPSSRMQAALERELGRAAEPGGRAPAPRYSSATTLRSWKWASWSLAGAAAVAVGLALYVLRQPSAMPPSRSAKEVAQMASVNPPSAATGSAAVADRYEPVEATSVFYDLHESAPRTLPDRTEGREVRYRFVDTYTWKNPATNASVSWSVPRDEVRLVRANFD